MCKRCNESGTHRLAESLGGRWPLRASFDSSGVTRVGFARPPLPPPRRIPLDGAERATLAPVSRGRNAVLHDDSCQRIRQEAWPGLSIRPFQTQISRSLAFSTSRSDTTTRCCRGERTVCRPMHSPARDASSIHRTCERTSRPRIPADRPRTPESARCGCLTLSRVPPSLDVAHRAIAISQTAWTACNLMRVASGFRLSPIVSTGNPFVTGLPMTRYRPLAMNHRGMAPISRTPLVVLRRLREEETSPLQRRRTEGQHLASRPREGTGWDLPKVPSTTRRGRHECWPRAGSDASTHCSTWRLSPPFGGGTCRAGGPGVWISLLREGASICPTTVPRPGRGGPSPSAPLRPCRFYDACGRAAW